MSAQYDEIGATYVAWKDTPIPRYAEVPTVRRLLTGLIERRAVLDLACGTGYYSRLFRQWGAARVVGVDVSESMVAAARDAEMKHPMGIEYFVGDAADLSVLGSFDFAAATYLLHYAETVNDMRRMARSMAANLKPGGQMLALLPEPGYVMGQGETEQYGFTYRLVTSGQDWRLVHADVHTEPPFSIEYRHWSRNIYEEALTAAGFTDLRWHPFEVSSEGLAKFGEAYWRDILNNPVSAILTARLSKESGAITSRKAPCPPPTTLGP
ncbi:MAG TPA: class I SAM-dependent methyltransferase [Nitrospira sp.]|nr:class I SAM-dependent methyltransferase [Nitrospira sp.]